MRKNAKKEKIPGGLRLSIGIDGEKTDGNKNLIWIINVLIVILGTFGALFSFTSAYELSEFTGVILFASLICGGVSGFLYGVRKFAVWYLPCGLGLLALTGFGIKEDLQNFGIFLWNGAVKVLGEHNMNYHLLYGGNFPDFSGTAVWFFTAFAFSIIIGFFAVYKVHFLPVLIVTFIPMELALYFGLVPNIAAVICFFSCNGAVLAKSLMRTKRKNLTKAKKAKRLGENYGLSVVSLIICLFFTVSLLASYAGVAISGYERPAKFDELRKRFTDFDISTAFRKQEEVIDLSLQGDRSYDYKIDITLEVPAYNNSAMYLKSSTGSVYSDNKWLDLEPSAYEAAPIPAMTENNVSVSELYAADISKTANIGVMKFALASELKGRTFLPYGVYNGDILTNDYDKGAVLSNKSDNYAVSYDLTANNALSRLSGSFITEETGHYKSRLFRYWDENYGYFVKNNYTKLPGGLDKIKASADEISASFNEMSVLTEKIDAVRNYLKENAGYSLEPGYTPSDEDFTEYFLFENHKGYCVHFATAGVLLLRAMGIPARYAEGYVLTQEDYKNAEDLGREALTADCLENGEKSKTGITQNTKKIELMDSNAHAWAEVYVNSLGWIPCEMTPGAAQSAANTSHPDNDTTEQPVHTTVPQTAAAAVPTEATAVKGGISNASNITVTKTESTSSVFVLILVAALIVILTDVLIRKAVIFRRNKSFHTKNAAENLTALYYYLERLLALSGCKPSRNQTVTDGFEQLFRTFDFLVEEECVNMVVIFRKAFYGAENITEQEQQQAEQFVLGFAQKWIKRQNAFKRFVYKYLMFVV